MTAIDFIASQIGRVTHSDRAGDELTTLDPLTGQGSNEDQSRSAGETPSLDSQASNVALKTLAAEGTSSPETRTLPAPVNPASQVDSSASQDGNVTQVSDARGPFSSSQWNREAQCISAAGTLSAPDPISSAHTIAESHQGPILYNPFLCLLSDNLDDLEALRIATENRVRALTRSETDSDGLVRGLGLDARSPEVARAMGLVDSLKALEHQAALDLRRELRRSPLHAWVLREKGIGEKQAARLLAVIGDPYWNDLHDRPRTVSELWAYSGYAVHGGVADRRRKGVRQNWNDKAKMRAFLMAEKCSMQPAGNHYRDVYVAARTQYVAATHSTECVRCGPKGKPALPGSALSAGHQHARALRRVAKEILRDLWVEARAFHEGQSES